ncbi:Elicitin [Phytophthora megakarya]|uniref:Elicitin n=1 Tax=Phytophthora megakarya TaxID=4795 RepID=A0A225WU81_9STRA|nr:Elicitin [Phytophthora megakarya]
MKTFAYAAAAAAACLATQSDAYSTTACPSSETAKLLALAADPYLDSCQTASGYTFVPPSAYPTESQVLLMCLTSDCYSLIADLLALEPADCVINFGTVSINVLELAESFLPNCTALGLSA